MASTSTFRRPWLPIRLRKLIGTVVLLVLVVLYSLVAMALAVRLLPGLPWYAHTAFFLVGGLLWVLPSMVLIRWMLRPDAPPGPAIP